MTGADRDLLERLRQNVSTTMPADLGAGDVPDHVREALPEATAAAVLIPVVVHDEPTILLTERSPGLKHHAGQISFPGGRLEPGDPDAVFAALRETQEEVGLEPHRVETIGYLDKYLTITGYSVTPVIGLVQPGFDLQLDRTEVISAFEVPLSYLMNPENHLRQRYQIKGARVYVYSIPYESHNIWGATAAMLVRLYRTIFDE